MLASQKEKALVTGASSGIGREIARVLGSQGCDLVITARRKAELESLAKELTVRHSIEVKVVVSDLSEQVGVENLIRDTGKIDILVNNAALYGSLKGGRFDVLREDDWNDCMNVNVNGIWRCCKSMVKSVL